MNRTDVVPEIKAAASRHDEAACTLIAVHSFAAGAEQLCLAVEALAGYFVGSAARTPSKTATGGWPGFRNCRRAWPFTSSSIHSM